MPTLAQPKNTIMQAATKAALAKFAALLLSLFVITTTGCKKIVNDLWPEPIPTPTPCDTCLPPITTHGAGTFGCKINGKPFVAKGNSMKRGTQLDINNLWVSVWGMDYSDKINYPDISITIEPLLDTGVIYFPNSSISSWVQHRFDNKIYSSNNLTNGYVHFLRVDYNRRVFSGTFEFDVYSNDGKDTMHITEGRFDVPH
jgi:hypothetical protein